MPVICCVTGCTNRYLKGGNVHFYRIPSDPERKEQWLSALCRKHWKPSTWSGICNSHFVSGKPSANPYEVDFVPSLKMGTGSNKFGDIKRKAANGDRFLSKSEPSARVFEQLIKVGKSCLPRDPGSAARKKSFEKTNDKPPRHLKRSAPTSVPCEYLIQNNRPPPSTPPKKLHRAIDRYPIIKKMRDSMRQQKPNFQREASPSKREVNLSKRESSPIKRESSPIKRESSPTKRVSNELPKLVRPLTPKRRQKDLKSEIKSLTNKIRGLEELNERTKYGENLLRGDDKRTRHLTGIPTYTAFCWILSICHAVLPKSRNLSPGDTLIMVLSKLKLDLTSLALADRYNITQSRAEQILHLSIPLLAKRLQCIGREDRIHVLPEDFKQGIYRVLLILTVKKHL